MVQRNFAYILISLLVGVHFFIHATEKRLKDLKTLVCNNDVTRLKEELPTTIKNTDQYNDLLFTAINACSYECLSLLLAHGAQPNCLNTQSRLAPLHLAIITRNDYAFFALLNHPDINPNIINIEGKTPLHFVANQWGYGEKEMKIRANSLLKTLMDHKDINPNLEDYRERTPLQQESLSYSFVKHFLKYGSVDPNKINHEGETILFQYLKILDEHQTQPKIYKLIRCLLNHPLVDLELLNFYQGLQYTYLMKAAEMGNKVVVSMLLDKKANPNHAIHGSAYPIHCGIFSKNVEIVKKLVFAGARIDSLLEWKVEQHFKEKFPEFKDKDIAQLTPYQIAINEELYEIANIIKHKNTSNIIGFDSIFKGLLLRERGFSKRLIKQICSTPHKINDNEDRQNK